MSKIEKTDKTESKEIEKRDARAEMITDDYTGPLYIPDEYKREGYHRHIADSTRGGWVNQLIRMGYSVVQDKSKVATGHSVSSIDSAVRFFLKENEKEPSGILMETPEELYQLRKKKEQEVADKQLRMVGKTGISTQVGEVTIGQDTFK